MQDVIADCSLAASRRGHRRIATSASPAVTSAGRGYLSVKVTVTVITMGTGTPFSRVGV
jgi:hypothetical protein